jgi:hypothetical protein
MRILVRFFLVLLLCCCCWASAQRGHHDPTPQDRNANPDRQLATGATVDPAQLKKDADELAQLASTVPAGVVRAVNGTLDKDLKDRLKKIEKLSKRLRSELALR